MNSTDGAALTLTFPFDRETVITRVFDAPRRLGFATITKPFSCATSDIDDDPEAFHVTVTFETLGDKAQLTMRSPFATAAQREATLAFGAVEGGQQTLARLAEHLTKMA